MRSAFLEEGFFTLYSNAAQKLRMITAYRFRFNEAGNAPLVKGMGVEGLVEAPNQT